ncbi:hypothetical protein PTSG_13150 [Salpingoeca rosetta]|uniref:Uncharacterized protein n=1 Tax=Salpingoeca rosetta (strain ATCC 50818 / BSB-021) TaxID=946362 RepID=F2USN7_SALR5|nr:uncharacterized protein PTSG_13150 [Salpingoeca rosetta]EGD81146.1 hypothetical protein PTSG_13150 [Salpingoeca rosetta]|eukprot:XP_004987831.1 hypothetical protein PTSG_13150 [Salpingoeca rosetta]
MDKNAVAAGDDMDAGLLERRLRETADHVRSRIGRMSIPQTSHLDCHALLAEAHMQYTRSHQTTPQYAVTSDLLSRLNKFALEAANSNSARDDPQQLASAVSGILTSKRFQAFKMAYLRNLKLASETLVASAEEQVANGAGMEGLPPEPMSQLDAFIHQMEMDSSGWGLLPRPRELRRIIIAVTSPQLSMEERAAALHHLWSSSFEEITALAEWPVMQQSIVAMLASSSAAAAATARQFVVHAVTPSNVLSYTEAFTIYARTIATCREQGQHRHQQQFEDAHVMLQILSTLPRVWLRYSQATVNDLADQLTPLLAIDEGNMHASFLGILAHFDPHARWFVRWTSTTIGRTAFVSAFRHHPHVLQSMIASLHVLVYRPHSHRHPHLLLALIGVISQLCLSKPGRALFPIVARHPRTINDNDASKGGGGGGKFDDGDDGSTHHWSPFKLSDALELLARVTAANPMQMPAVKAANSTPTSTKPTTNPSVPPPPPPSSSPSSSSSSSSPSSSSTPTTSSPAGCARAWRLMSRRAHATLATLASAHLDTQLCLLSSNALRIVVQPIVACARAGAVDGESAGVVVGALDVVAKCCMTEQGRAYMLALSLDTDTATATHETPSSTTAAVQSHNHATTATTATTATLTLVLAALARSFVASLHHQQEPWFTRGLELALLALRRLTAFQQHDVWGRVSWHMLASLNACGSTVSDIILDAILNYALTPVGAQALMQCKHVSTCLQRLLVKFSSNKQLSTLERFGYGSVLVEISTSAHGFQLIQSAGFVDRLVTDFASNCDSSSDIPLPPFSPDNTHARDKAVAYVIKVLTMPAAVRQQLACKQRWLMELITSPDLCLSLTGSQHQAELDSLRIIAAMLSSLSVRVLLTHTHAILTRVQEHQQRDTSPHGVVYSPRSLLRNRILVWCLCVGGPTEKTVPPSQLPAITTAAAPTSPSPPSSPLPPASLLSSSTLPELFVDGIPSCYLSNPIDRTPVSTPPAFDAMLAHVRSSTATLGALQSCMWQLLQECRCGGGRWIAQRREDVSHVLEHAVGLICSTHNDDRGGDRECDDGGGANGEGNTSTQQQQKQHQQQNQHQRKQPVCPCTCASAGDGGGGEDAWVTLSIDYGRRCGMVPDDEVDAYTTALLASKHMRTCAQHSPHTDAKACTDDEALRQLRNRYETDVCSDWFVSTIMLLSGPGTGPHLLQQLSRAPCSRYLWFHPQSTTAYSTALSQHIQHACEVFTPQVHTALRLAGLSTSHVCSLWLEQVFWNYLDWQEVVLYVLASIVIGPSFALATCVAALKHLQDSILVQPPTYLDDMLRLSQLGGFSFAAATPLIKSLHDTYAAALN